MVIEANLHALARFVPEFERADFSPEEQAPVRERKSDAFPADHATLSAAALEFVGAAYEGGWMIRDFNWPQWKRTEEANALFHDPDALSRATPLQLAQLLTLFIRQDRFNEGGLLANFKSGHILAIVQRAANLLIIEESSSQR